jgi:hypothetical protein
MDDMFDDDGVQAGIDWLNQIYARQSAPVQDGAAK